jgi:hypothetical protein
MAEVPQKPEQFAAEAASARFAVRQLRAARDTDRRRPSKRVAFSAPAAVRASAVVFISTKPLLRCRPVAASRFSFTESTVPNRPNASVSISSVAEGGKLLT